MKLIMMIWLEIKKEISTTWSYKYQWIGELMSLVVFYFFLSNLSNKLEIAILGYCLWFYSMLIVGDISGKISTELKLGTFEQVYLSTFSIFTLLSAKITASIAKSVLLVSCLLLFLAIEKHLNFENSFIPLFLISVALVTPGLFGISFLLGGITLNFREAGWLLNIFNNSMLFLSGAFLSMRTFPEWIQKVSVILPTTQVIEILNTENRSYQDFSRLIIFSMFYLLLGCTIFRLCNNKAKSRGILSHY